MLSLSNGDAIVNDLSFFLRMDLTVLYRPARRREYELIEAMAFRSFPPRLPEQPFFYPVTNEDCATQIARDWNAKDEASGWTGYVLRFRVRSVFLREYPVQTVGSSKHSEYWIPTADAPHPLRPHHHDRRNNNHR